MRGLRIGWVLGWAIPPEWFRPQAEDILPEAEHVLFEPSPQSWDELAAAAPFDWVVGYSLGSLLLLQNPEQASALGNVALLAPIWNFAAEANAGGRIARANLRALTRAYRNDPERALDSFYATAGLAESAGGEPRHPGPVRGLTEPKLWLARNIGQWGLEQLDRAALSPALPAHWRAFVGANDPLLDAARLQTLVPAVNVISGAAHRPAELIAAFAAALP